jgi:hypothetical protein
LDELELYDLRVYINEKYNIANILPDVVFPSKNDATAS